MPTRHYPPQEQMTQAQIQAELKEDALLKAAEHEDHLRRVELEKRTAERDAALADYRPS